MRGLLPLLLPVAALGLSASAPALPKLRGGAGNTLELHQGQVMAAAGSPLPPDDGSALSPAQLWYWLTGALHAWYMDISCAADFPMAGLFFVPRLRVCISVSREKTCVFEYMYHSI